jgi:transcriptional regulator with XRE-family HTH domain
METTVPDALDLLDASALGARLRVLRKAAGRTLRDVADELDISVSAVSQIERGTLRPSVSRLLAIVQVLGVPLADVFDEDAPSVAAPSVTAPSSTTGYVLARAGAAHEVSLGGGVVFRRLSPGHMRGVDFFESTYPPGSEATDSTELITHSGYEVGTVRSGALTIEFADETVEVRAGDSITFPCAVPHRMSNRGAEPAVATWLIVHA